MLVLKRFGAYRKQRGWRGGAAAWLLLCGSLSWGCGHAAQPSQLFDQPNELLAQYRAKRPVLEGISAQARVDQRGAQGRVRGTVMLFAKPDGQVRFDVMTQFGPALILTSDGAQFALADLRERRFLTGPTCPANISRLLGIPLGVKAVGRILMGEAPAVQPTEQDLEFRDGRYHLTQHLAQGMRQVLELDVPAEQLQQPLSEQTLRLRAVRVYNAAGSIVWKAEYSDYQWVTGQDGLRVRLPFRVQVLQPSRDADTLVKFEDIALNPAIPGGAFEQVVPAGMVVENAPCEP